MSTRVQPREKRTEVKFQGFKFWRTLGSLPHLSFCRLGLDWRPRSSSLAWPPSGSNAPPGDVLTQGQEKVERFSNLSFPTSIVRLLWQRNATADKVSLARPLTSLGRLEVRAAISCGRQKARGSREPSWMKMRLVIMIRMISPFFVFGQLKTLAPASLASCNGRSVAPACDSNSFLFSSMAFLLPSSTRRSLSFTACSSSSCACSLSPRSLCRRRRSKQIKKTSLLHGCIVLY